MEGNAEMKALIMANGEYGDSEWYRVRAQNYQLIICADGGANQAARLGIVPDMVIGDMDSIEEKYRLELKGVGAQFFPFSTDKDFTDTQLAMEIAEEKGIKSITIWGGTGNRIDHSIANIFSAIRSVNKGIHVQFESPTETIYYVKDQLSLEGNIGDIVSILALGERASGVSLTGFKYPLFKATLEANLPIGISNSMIETGALIEVESGILAVFHNH
jgi:thiamine pyrophosphokinase